MQPPALYPVRRAAFICAILTCTFFLVPTQSHAQGNNGDVTNGGTEFLLCFMANEAPGYDQSTNRYQDIYIASGSDSATVTITCRAFSKWNHVIQLGPNEALSYRLSTDPEIGYPTHDALIEIPEVIDSTVFKVVSTTPITCYGMSHKEFSCDAFLALPRNVASTEYLVMSYYNSNQLGLDPMPSEFCVASFDDANTITIIPSALTSSGNPKSKAMTFTLDAGECVQIQADMNDVGGDLTGSIVRSTSPIVVYGGSRRTEVPTGFFNINNGSHTTSRDHLSEAIPPLSTWGLSFITKNFGRPDGDLMRIVASKGNTVLKINGQIWGNPLKAREFRDTLIAQSSVMTDNIFGVEASDPVLVGMIAHTADAVTQNGDPFLALMPPLDQTYHDYTYFISDDKTNFDMTTQYVIVATEISGAGLITIDGNIIPKGAYTNLPLTINGKQYAVVTVKQSAGIHRITSPNADENGFTILAYGFGVVDSYGYTAGALLKPITGILNVASDGPPDGKISVRNILAEKVYLDSSSVTYTYNPSNVTVALKNILSTETGTLNIGEEKGFDLSALSKVADVVKGNIRLFYHTAKWSDLKPVDFPFSMNSLAGVGNSSSQLVSLSTFPNPASGELTISYSINSRAYTTVKLYDALGRVVRLVTQGMMNTGNQEVRVSTHGLIPGEYTVELTAPAAGINLHKKLIVVE
jgi:hypothetical protein